MRGSACSFYEAIGDLRGDRHSNAWRGRSSLPTSGPTWQVFVHAQTGHGFDAREGPESLCDGDGASFSGERDRRDARQHFA